MVDVYRGENLSKVCSIVRNQNTNIFKLEHEYKVLAPGGAVVFRMSKGSNIGIYFHTADEGTVIFMAATGFGWYIFREGDPYLTKAEDEEMYLVGLLGFIEKAFENDGLLPSFR